MSRAHNRLMVWAFHHVEGMRLRKRFLFLGKGQRPYTKRQKEFALGLIDEKGVRATSRILKMPRRSIQRWCREYGKTVKRCPDWVRDWALRRRYRREFWRRRGYY